MSMTSKGRACRETDGDQGRVKVDVRGAFPGTHQRRTGQPRAVDQRLKRGLLWKY